MAKPTSFRLTDSDHYRLDQIQKNYSKHLGRNISKSHAISMILINECSMLGIPISQDAEINSSMINNNFSEAK